MHIRSHVLVSIQQFVLEVLALEGFSRIYLGRHHTTLPWVCGSPQSDPSSRREQRFSAPEQAFPPEVSAQSGTHDFSTGSRYSLSNVTL